MYTPLNNVFPEVTELLNRNLLMKILAVVVVVFFLGFVVGYTAHFVWGLFS